VNLTTVPPRNR